MSIALERGSGNTIQRSGFIHGMSCISLYDSSDSGRRVPGAFAGHHRGLPEKSREREQEELGPCSSSSIGRNSDLSDGSSDGDDSGETEVQSSLKGPLDTMDALEEVLPIRRGISKFYNGKSKSFTSLADVSPSSSIKDLAKPENTYTKKRKNLLAHSSNFWDKNCNFPLRSGGGGGISKRPTNSSRNTLALAVTMSGSGCNNSSEDSNLNSSPSHRLPPLPPQSKGSPNSGSSSPPPRQNFTPLRSFSLSDLQCIAPATPGITGLVINDRDQDNSNYINIKL